MSLRPIKRGFSSSPFAWHSIGSLRPKKSGFSLNFLVATPSRPAHGLQTFGFGSPCEQKIPPGTHFYLVVICGCLGHNRGICLLMSTPSLLIICSILLKMIPSFRRRRPPRIRTCWSTHHPESHRMGSESSLHPGQRLSTLRIFAVQRSLPGAARPAVRPECPSRVSPAPIAKANQPRERRHLLIADGRHRAYVCSPDIQDTAAGATDRRPGAEEPGAQTASDTLQVLATMSLGVCECCKITICGGPHRDRRRRRSLRAHSRAARAEFEQVSFRRGRHCRP